MSSEANILQFNLNWRIHVCPIELSPLVRLNTQTPGRSNTIPHGAEEGRPKGAYDKARKLVLSKIAYQSINNC